MNILYALLAFTVTMLVLSTMSLSILEFVYRLKKSREIYFKQMIGVLFDELIWPRVRKLFTGKTDLKEIRNEFVASMTSVSGLIALDGVVKENKKKGKKTNNVYTPSKSTERLNGIEFAQRFARTKCGIQLMKAGEEKVKILVMDLAKHLEAISFGASSDFRTRSKNYSLLIAIVLAFTLNVDAFHLFKSYLNDSQLSQKLIELQPDISKDYQELNQKILILKSTTPDSTEEKQSFKQFLNDAKETQQTIKNNAAKLSGQGVPIGWEQFPYCQQPPKGKLILADNRCADNFEIADLSTFSFHQFLDFLAWLVGTIIAGFLIGQGSPFWFQMFQRLSLLAEVARNLGLAGKTEKEKKDNQGDDKQKNDKNPVNEFLIAARAEQLGRDGEGN